MLWSLGVICSKAIGIWIRRLSYLQSFNQFSASEIIKLDYIVVLIVSSQQNIPFKIKTITWNRRTIDFSNRSCCLSDVPDLHSRVPAPTKKNIGIFLQTFYWKNSINVMIDFKLLRPSRLERLYLLQGFIVKNLYSVDICSKNTPFLIALIITT